MENTQMETEPVIVVKKKKTEDRREYMREYMRKRHAENPERTNSYNRIWSYKKKYEIDTEDLEKYGDYTTDIAKLRMLLTKLPAEYINEEILKYQQKLHPDNTQTTQTKK
jgi:hypothetical protein